MNNRMIKRYDHISAINMRNDEQSKKQGILQSYRIDGSNPLYRATSIVERVSQRINAAIECGRTDKRHSIY